MHNTNCNSLASFYLLGKNNYTDGALQDHGLTHDQHSMHQENPCHITVNHYRTKPAQTEHRKGKD
jgi:hypothetical protein